MSLQTRVAMETRSNKLTLRTVHATQKGRPHSHRPRSTCNKARKTHRCVGDTNSYHTYSIAAGAQTHTITVLARHQRSSTESSMFLMNTKC